MATCIGINFKSFSGRLQRLVGGKPKPEKRTLQISAPFNFKHEASALPGVSEDEIAILKDKAAASRIGVADGSAGGNPPRRAPAPPRPLPPQMTEISGNTPVMPHATDNLI